MPVRTYRHRLYGLRIESVFPLPGAPSVSRFDGPPDLTFSWEPASDRIPEPWRITMPAPNRAYPDVGVAEDGAACLVWRNELRFDIAPRLDRVRLVSRPAKLEYAPIVVVGFVLGYVLYLRGALCLHGSVLERDGQAFAMLGNGGAGKSTVAAALVRRRGAHLLSDDLVVVGRTAPRVQVEPGCASVRLGRAAAETVLGYAGDLPRVPYLDKLSWDLSGRLDVPDARYCDRPTPLAQMYFLQNGDGVSRVAIGPRLSTPEALRYLTAAQYPPGHLHLVSQERLRELGALAAAVPLRVIRYPKSWEHLSQLIEQVCP
jgi:hypothetical protein